MPHKRHRSRAEKVAEALDCKVKNIRPDLRNKLYLELQTLLEVPNDVAKIQRYVCKLLKTPESGIHTKMYWVARGWTEAESHFHSGRHSRTGFVSPYSREFWTSRINPSTNTHYTELEADYERNSRRPIRKEYWMKKGLDESEAIKMAEKKKKSNDKSGQESTTSEIRRITSRRSIQYWTIRGYTEEDAIKKVAESQVTFSLGVCIEKYGEEGGRKRWLERQQKWHKSFKKSNFSKVSQDLFWEVVPHLSSLEHVYFAELGPDKKIDKTGVNNEFRLTLDRSIMPDFLDAEQKKIIEFDGYYWHGVGRGNRRRNEDKDAVYAQHGYKVLRIPEKEYMKDKKTQVQKCIDFLKP